jgi:hypothetical protein
MPFSIDATQTEATSMAVQTAHPYAAPVVCRITAEKENV